MFIKSNKGANMDKVKKQHVVENKKQPKGKGKKQALIEKRKRDAETWEDIKMVLLVMGIAIAAISVVAASIYYANMGQ